MANFSISTTLAHVCDLFEQEVNIQDLVSFFRSTDMTFEIGIDCRGENIHDMSSLKKWVNSKTQVTYVDKSEVKYTTKNGRPIYARRKMYPNALNGRQIAGILKTFPKNVEFIFF